MFLFPDMAEIKEDKKRTEEFVQLCATLKTYAGSRVTLPDATVLLDMFGKVPFLETPKPLQMAQHYYRCTYLCIVAGFVAICFDNTSLTSKIYALLVHVHAPVDSPYIQVPLYYKKKKC